MRIGSLYYLNSDVYLQANLSVASIPFTKEAERERTVFIVSIPIIRAVPSVFHSPEPRANKHHTSPRQNMASSSGPCRKASRASSAGEGSRSKKARLTRVLPGLAEPGSPLQQTADEHATSFTAPSPSRNNMEVGSNGDSFALADASLSVTDRRHGAGASIIKFR